MPWIAAGIADSDLTVCAPSDHQPPVVCDGDRFQAPDPAIDRGGFSALVQIPKSDSASSQS
jgi:hypothetical protein